MIRINLIAGTDPRRPSAAARFFAVRADQRPALIGASVLMGTALAVGASWWSLDRQLRAVAAHIAAQDAEAVRLQDAIRRVERADARVQELDARLAFIERLRARQRAPVALLDAISAALPDGVWLLELQQQDAAMRVDGRALSLHALTDFADRLQTSGRMPSPIEIVSTTTENVGDTPVIRFALQASTSGGQ